jgi:NADH:ubiquinone oxidoreductase subunit 6 (subunit J)
MTGYACAFYYRHELLKSVRNLLFVGVAPVVGALMLTYLFVKSLVEWSDPANSASGSSWFGFAPPAVIGVGFLVLGALLLMAWRQHRREPFFGLRRETADPGLLDGTVEPAAALAGTD